MNSEGYIPLILVSGFPRVQAITNDLFLISQVLQHSTEVELSPNGLQVIFKNFIFFYNVLCYYVLYYVNY